MTDRLLLAACAALVALGLGLGAYALRDQRCKVDVLYLWHAGWGGWAEWHCRREY